MFTVEQLKEARERIADRKRWTRGAPARRRNGHPTHPLSTAAVKWCALGALMRSGYPGWTDDDFDAYWAIDKTVREGGGYSLTYLNDVDGHAAVLAVLDRAIALLETTE